MGGDCVHFVVWGRRRMFFIFCVCPVLGDVRRMHLSRRVIGMERCLDLLNGSQWDALYGYVCQAMNVRKGLVGV